MFTVNLCHFHVVHQEQKPQHWTQLLANPLQSPHPMQHKQSFKHVHRDCHHHSHFNQSNRAPHIASAGAINHPSSADVQKFCIIMLNTNQSLQSHATSTETRTQFAMEPFHVHGQPLQRMEQSQSTISKESMQDHIHRRKMSRVLLSRHLCKGSDQTILL